jgi:ATP-binding cassette subfamily C (CFTR/MRP) protein 1
MAQAVFSHPAAPPGQSPVDSSAAPFSAMFYSGSISGLGLPAVARLGSGYATATRDYVQPLCANEEGWGPLSPYRWDFTPCFIDVWIASVAVFGVACGAAALAWLYKNRPPRDLAKNLHFWVKQSLLAFLLAVVAVQLAVQISDLPGVWMGDFRFYTTVATILSLGVVFAVQWVEHDRVRNANAVVLLYWTGLLVALAVKLRSLVSQGTYDESPRYFVAYCVGFAAAALSFLVEWLWPRSGAGYAALVDDDECPADYATIFSRLTYSWMTPMMKRGYEVFLTEDDLWALAKADTTDRSSATFERAWAGELARRPVQPSMWRALGAAYGPAYAIGIVYKLGNDIAQFAQPQLLRYLIVFIDSWRPGALGGGGAEPQPVIQGLVIALGMFALSVIQTFNVHAYFQNSFVVGMRLRAGLSAAVYRKSMRLSNEARADKTTGDVVNYMAVDTQRLQDVTQFLHQLWSAPLQIVICMVSLYNLVGWSMMSGVAVMLVSMPMQGWIAKKMKTLQEEQMKNKDSRTRLINEIVANMKSIKLFAWGAAFMNKLSHVRNDLELRTLRKIGATQAFANLTWNIAPFFVSCLTFTTYVYTQDKPLTSEIIFASLTLFNLLSFPLAVLPMILMAMVNARVSADRLRDFFVAEELQPDAVTVGPAPAALGEETVVVRGATLKWDRHAPATALTDVDFAAYKGELSCIVGRVGSGKSSLLSALLGDLYRVSGSVAVNGHVAYVAQKAWILNASVRDNIIFGHRYDPAFYRRTVEACALVDDFAALPDGDETVVGERGISLSGGQRARVGLARAVYARADVFLLDDVLSAVDAHVGRHIIDHVLGPRGLLASKTRILATNAIAVLRHATYITMLQDGAVVERGTYKELMAAKSQVAELVRTTQQQHGSGSGGPSSASAPDSGASSGGSNSETSTIIDGIDGGKKASSADATSAVDDDNDDNDSDGVAELAPIKAGASSSTAATRPRKDSTTTLRRASHASLHGPRGRPATDEEAAAGGITAADARTKQAKEHAEQGSVDWKVYVEYAKNGEVPAVVTYLVALVLAQAVNVGASYWLKVWSDHNTAAGGNDRPGHFIGIYLAFGLGGSFLSMVSMLVLWIFCSIEASRKLHERMANAIFRSPMSFFDTTPAGRILNRFSSDIYRVDEVLARTFNFLFVNAARSAATLIIISATTPSFMALIVPLCLTYLWVQRYYLQTSRELKRLDSVTKSPVYSHFQETLGGTSTIRAYRQEARFLHDNEWRLDANNRAYFPSATANRWLGVRLELIGAVVILGAAVFPIMAVANGAVISSGLVGLAMSYALQITTSLSWIVRQAVEVETNIVAVERVLEYANLPSEAAEIVAERRPPAAWPADGAVSFENYSARYRDNLDLVLKNIDISIKSHEKIGVVGRTGAGKSSLTLALFRIIEPAEGRIDIDAVDTSRMGLLDLRRRLAIIPQDAALFEGSVRDNLDPGHVHEDAALWDVLEHARLRDHVCSMDGGLDAKINEGGSNLSHGQRQLVSLARAMLTPSNILVLDEATASVDVETDALVQETLRSQLFANRTIITIAHRINTIMDSDRVLVLDKGRVVEFDSPERLLARGEGMFWDLVRSAGADDARRDGGEEAAGEEQH